MKGIRLLDFADKYRSRYQEALLGYGHDNISSLLSSLTDVLRLQQSSTGAFYVYPKTASGAASHASQSSSATKQPKLVSDEVKASLARCISEFPEGISVVDFLQKYKVKLNLRGFQMLKKLKTLFLFIAEL